MARIKNLEDLCFNCPDGTIGIVAGCARAEFGCKTDKDRDFVYKYAGKIGCSVEIISKPMTLLVKYF